MLGCRLSFKAYVKNVQVKATKRSVNTTENLLDPDRHVLTYV